MTSRRKIKNFVLSPKRQLYFFLPGVLQFFVLSSVQFLFIYGTWRNVTAIASENLSPERAFELQSLFFNLALSAGLALVFTGLGCFYLFVRQSHRWFGPQIPIIRHLDRLTKGESVGSLRAREGDELDEVVAAINRLSAALEQNP